MSEDYHINSEDFPFVVNVVVVNSALA